MTRQFPYQRELVKQRIRRKKFIKRTGRYKISIYQEGIMIKDPETIEYWINKVQNEGRDLTPWEQEFMESIHDRFERTHTLTDRQEEILERIYSEKTPT